MGYTNWSDSHYTDRAKLRASTGAPTFAYHAATAAAPPSDHKAHKSLDPKGVKIRESRDSADHSDSRAVAVLFDVTGSMQTVPSILQANLPKLMGLLIRKGYLPHPQIMVGAIGDATCDRVPLQVGQFESGIEIENDLTNLFLEGGGGGQTTESYELAMYFVARKTVTDAWEKRGQKGYLFIIGDEMPYPLVKRHEVAGQIGDTLEADISVEAIIAELQEKWEVFYILPRMTSHYSHPPIYARWEKLLGQNCLKLEQPEAVCDLIATTIGLCEGSELDKLAGDLVDSGTSAAGVAAVRGALAPIAAGRESGLAVALPDSGAGSGVATV